MKHLLFCAAALIAAPAMAQAPTPDPVAAASSQVDPPRLAAARVTVDKVWPLGTYERMMRGTMDQIMDGTLASMFDMKMGDLAASAPGGKPVSRETAEMSIREMARKEDPHFEERMRITTKVMMEEMIPLMSSLEPDIREGLARAYARRFDTAQLTEMNRFFATPAGSAYARESMTIMTDPEMVSAIARFGPEMVKEMPRIMQKMEAATAHLPPPKAQRAGKAR